MTSEAFSVPYSGDETLPAIGDIIRTLGSSASNSIGAQWQPEASFASSPEAVSAPDLDQQYSLDTVFGDRSEEIHDQLHTIQKRLEDGDWPDVITGYVSEGTVSAIYRIPDVCPGKKILAKVPHQIVDDYPQTDLADMVEAFTRGADVPDTARLVAYSRDPRGLLVEEIEGDDLTSLEARERLSIPVMRRLLRTYVAMQQRGLGADNEYGSNTILTPDERLIIIDYDYKPDQSLQQKVVSFGSHGVLLYHSRLQLRLDYLPAVALRYRRACYEELGMKFVEPLNALWRSYGLHVPRFDPDEEL